jgi:hypothetical protein
MWAVAWVPLGTIDCLAAAYAHHSELYCAGSSGWCTTRSICHDGSGTTPGPLSTADMLWSARSLRAHGGNVAATRAARCLAQNPLRRHSKLTCGRAKCPGKPAVGCTPEAMRGRLPSMLHMLACVVVRTRSDGRAGPLMMRAQRMCVHLPERVRARSYAASYPSAYALPSLWVRDGWSSVAGWAPAASAAFTTSPCTDAQALDELVPGRRRAEHLRGMPST